MNVPPTYLHWQSSARRLLEPLAGLMQPGRADLAIKGPASDHDAQADRLESFARPLLLAAHYLQSEPEADPAIRAFRARLAAWFRAGLVIGSDPASPHYWGPMPTTTSTTWRSASSASASPSPRASSGIR